MYKSRLLIRIIWSYSVSVFPELRFNSDENRSFASDSHAHPSDVPPPRRINRSIASGDRCSMYRSICVILCFLAAYCRQNSSVLSICICSILPQLKLNNTWPIISFVHNSQCEYIRWHSNTGVPRTYPQQMWFNVEQDRRARRRL